MTAPPHDPVHLAVAGAMVADGGGPPAATDSRVGGAPVLPGPPDGWSRPACGVCGADMALVLQAHAPLPRFPDRALLVFGCAGDECGRADGAWAAVRVQGAEKEEEEVEVEAATPPPPPPQPAAAAADDDWGLGDADACGDAAAALSLADVAAELESAAAALAAAPLAAAARPRDADAGPAPPPPPTWSPAGWKPPTLAEFYVSWTPEPVSAQKQPPSSTDDAHVAALLAAYRAAEGGGDDGEAVPDGEPCEGGTRPPTTMAATWSGETYEPDAAPGASAAYLAFANRVARVPGQVARYCRGGAPLWPLAPRGGAPPAPPPPPPCATCAAPRTWELALVSPLAAMLDEAASWAGGGGGCPAGWEWTTVAVATCGAAACSTGRAVREHVAVANEE